MRRRAFPLAVLTVALTTSVAPVAARGLDFAQLDGSSDSTTLVLVRALGDPQARRPAPLASATATRWHDGEAVAIGATWRHALGSTGGLAWRAGLGAGADHQASRAGGDRSTHDGASLRGQIEADGPLPGGAAGSPWRGYALLQASTFRGQWFASVQAAAPAGGVELWLGALAFPPADAELITRLARMAAR
jgi:hypothetical protein